MRVPLEVLSVITAVLDAGLFMLANVLALDLCKGCPRHLPQHYLSAAIISGAIIMGLFYFNGLYRLSAIIAPFRSLKRIVLGAISGFALVATVAVTQNFDESFLPEWAVLFLLFSIATVAGGRLAEFSVVYFLSHRGILRRRIAIVGASLQAQRMMKQLALEQPRINHVVGVFDDRRRTRNGDSADLKIDGGIGDLIAKVRHGQIDDVIIALPWNAEQRLLDIIGQLRQLPVHVSVGSDLISFHFPSEINTDFYRGLPMLEVVKKPLANWLSVVKAVEDRVLAVLILIVAAPLMVAIALAIRLESPGPAVFRQTRYGFNNQAFDVFKFRTMHLGAPGDVLRQVTRDDPRVTRVGRLLRRASLDELPQLFNVLSGKMSLVGPRPHAVDHNEYYGRIIDGYFARHKVKPGITGWAQVNGLRGETDTLEKMQYRVRYDVYYIENWSLLFDLEILMLTLFVGFAGRTAY